MKRALLIGINDYPEKPLFGCLNDMRNFDSIIARNGDNGKNMHTRKMSDVKSASEILAGIKTLFHDDAEMALLYFSGHGYLDHNGGFLVTPNEMMSTPSCPGIPFSDIMDIANASKAQNKVVILDCCHAGQCGDISSGALIGEGVSILAACRTQEGASEINGHGVFTGLLCDALSGGAADLNGNITIGNVYAYIDRSFNAWEQRPIFKTNVSTFVPLRTVTPTVSTDTFITLPRFFPYEDAEFQLDPSYEYTNTPGMEQKLVKPYAVPAHVSDLKILQKLQSVGLVEPVGAEHMYFAAINSKSCRLTTLGKHYLNLVKKEII